MPLTDTDMRRSVCSCATSRPRPSAARRSGLSPNTRTNSGSTENVSRNRSGPLRSKASSLVACFQALSISPSWWDSGMNASVKTTSLNSRAPDNCSIGLHWMPLVFFMSTRNEVSPCRRFSFVGGDVRKIAIR